MFLRKINELDSEFFFTNLKTEIENSILFSPIVYLIGEKLIHKNCEIEFQISLLNNNDQN